MVAEPQIKPLGYKKRTWFFRLLFSAFAILLPVIIFYTTGYRFDFTNDTTNIVSIGGLYVSVPAVDTDIFLDEKLVKDIRVFRRASYIQNVVAGVHELHVQGKDLQTWSKKLPVYPQIVTEVQAFNIPVRPQIRLITKWLTPNNVGIFLGASTSTINNKFSFASTSSPILSTTTTKTKLFTKNNEYDYVNSLFSTSSPSNSLVKKVVDEVSNTFTFSSSSTLATSTATSTIINRDTRLYEDNGEIFIEWTGADDNIPYYFCVKHTIATTTIAEYGEHVYKNVAAVIAQMPATESGAQTGRICRHKIRIDRKGQSVKTFSFLPGGTDLVLMQLEDGLYVVEVDDRSWQNTQLLYPGKDIEVTIDKGSIYVKDGVYLLEVFTDLQL